HALVDDHRPLREDRVWVAGVTRQLEARAPEGATRLVAPLRQGLERPALWRDDANRVHLLARRDVRREPDREGPLDERRELGGQRLRRRERQHELLALAAREPRRARTPPHRRAPAREVALEV